jgi:hypothetical protein
LLAWLAEAQIPEMFAARAKWRGRRFGRANTTPWPEALFAERKKGLEG